MTYCVECGTKLEPAWKYCPACGEKKVPMTTERLVEAARTWDGIENRQITQQPAVAAPASVTTPTPAADAQNNAVVPPPPPGYRPENVGDNRRTQRAAEKRQQKLEKKNRKRRKTKVVTLLVLLAGLIVGGGFGVKEGLEHNNYRRSIETAELLEAIETSESIMIAWQKDVDALVAAGGEIEQAVSSAAEKHLQELIAARKLLTSEGGLEIASWHDDIRAARDAYVIHRDAWESYLRAVARDSKEIMNEESIIRIDRSFALACRELVEIDLDAETYPNRSAGSERKIATICDGAFGSAPI
jgi:hypothetical protein